MSARSTKKQLPAIRDHTDEDPSAAAKVLSAILERSARVQAPAVKAYVDRLRSQRPEATPAEIITRLEKHYRGAVMASGAAVGSALASPDNLAIDHEGNIYIIEDRNGGSDDDIWFANDVNKDGDLTDPGEGLGRWATNGTPGSEFTGLYFDPTDKRRAWVNIQHPDSDNDRTIEITIP